MATYIDALNGDHTDGREQLTWNREDLIGEYAGRVVDGMDMDSLVVYALDKMMEDLRTYSDEDLHDEIAAFYPDLLEA